MGMNKEKKKLQVFAYGLGVIALGLGVGGLSRHGWTWDQAVKLAGGVFFIVMAVRQWASFRLAYKGWMAVAQVIGGAVTRLILIVVYYCVFTPVALFLRLMGKDHLERRRDPGRTTFWHARVHDQADTKRYQRQG